MKKVAEGLWYERGQVDLNELVMWNEEEEDYLESFGY